MNNSYAKLGILAGILYGLFIRVMADFSGFSNVFAIISYAFLFLTPIAIGAASVYIAAKKKRLNWREQMGIASITMLFFLLSMFLLVLEGLICIVLILPVFMIASIIGGLLMGFVINRSRYSKSTLNSLLLLPLILGPLEATLPITQSQHQVSSTIVINANAEDIFNQLATVSAINPDELGFSFMHFIGMPRPLEASMQGEGAGSVRTSRWEKGVQFQERIIVWNAPHQLHYEFDIPKGAIPREALDRYVELGGDYFTVLNGGYDIEVIDANTSRLTLKTTYHNKSHLQLYGNLWANYVLDDFHKSLLQLMKSRSEKI